MPPTTGFGGIVFADGCDKSHMGAVWGTEAKCREVQISDVPSCLEKCCREDGQRSQEEVEAARGRRGQVGAQPSMSARWPRFSRRGRPVHPFGRRQAANPLQTGCRESTHSSQWSLWASC